MATSDLTGITPEYLTLREVIARLEREDPAKRVPIGFKSPHSYRGYYEQLAFEVAYDITVGEMLAAAESAMGAAFQGWKGGEYVMDGDANCWLVPEEGTSSGETVGAVLLELMLRAGGRGRRDRGPRGAARPEEAVTAMSVVILDWPDGMDDEIVDEVVEATGIDEGAAELAVEIVASRVAEAIAEGLLKVRR